MVLTGNMDIVDRLKTLRSSSKWACGRLPNAVEPQRKMARNYQSFIKRYDESEYSVMQMPTGLLVGGVIRTRARR